MSLKDRCFEGCEVRRLEGEDYEKGFLDLLGQLTEVGVVGKSDFEKQLAKREAMGMVSVVIEDVVLRKVVATGSILFEEKFTRSCGKVGHIEDIVVSKDHRGGKLGARIMNALQEIALMANCYKIILDCSEANQAFYEKQGFIRKEVQMRYDISKNLTLEEFRKGNVFVQAA